MINFYHCIYYQMPPLKIEFLWSFFFLASQFYCTYSGSPSQGGVCLLMSIKAKLAIVMKMERLKMGNYGIYFQKVSLPFSLPLLTYFILKARTEMGVIGCNVDGVTPFLTIQ